MTLLDRTRQLLPPSPASERRRLHRVLVAAGHGAVGAVASALVLVVPVLLAWLVDDDSSASWSDALGFAADGWVLAHRGRVVVPADGVAVTAAPLLLTALAVLLARTAARSALAQTTRRTRREWPLLLGGHVLGYTLTGVVIAFVGYAGPARPDLLRTVPGTAVVAALGALWALWRDHVDGDQLVRSTVRGRGGRLPATLVRAVRPALEGLVVLLAVGLLVVLAMVATSWTRVTAIHSELDAGIVGGTLLVAGQLLTGPNLAAFATSWLSGAGVHVGTVTVGHAAVTPGVLPMVPVLGALPEAGAGPWWSPVVPVVPVLVGALTGWRTLRRLTLLAPLREKVRTAALAAVLAGSGLLLVAFGGSMGVDGSSLEYVGPGLVAVPLLLAELAAGAVVAALALHAWRTRA